MALLNPPQILPNVAVVLFRALRSADNYELTREDLERTVAPAALPRGEGAATGPGSKGLDDTLNACVVIKMFEREGESVRLHPELPDDVRDRRREPDLRRLIRRLVLREELNFGLWDSTEGARDLTRALAWYLAQDPLRAPGAWNEPHGVDIVQERQFGAGERVFSNDTRWGAFDRWASFLGFGVHIPRDNKNVLLPDPTGAVRDVLTEVLTATRQEVAPVVEELGRRIPVLDSGTYRREVEDRMRPDAVIASADSISPSLTHALLRLRDERALVLEDLADAPMKMRLPEGYGPERTITHLSLDSGKRRGRR
ncbi:MAG TPA: protein DpdG [Acidimicrobiales bacterium]|nr:protein DpdG [Acidimicrobiales bacterium]